MATFFLWSCNGIIPGKSIGAVAWQIFMYMKYCNIHHLIYLSLKPGIIIIILVTGPIRAAIWLLNIDKTLDGRTLINLSLCKSIYIPLLSL